MTLAGWPPAIGLPGRDGAVGVWGHKPASHRGRWLARHAGAHLVTIEDGFLRSVLPGVTGEAPVSLVIDDTGIYYDASRPSRLEQLVKTPPGDLDRSRAAEARAQLQRLRLSKYNLRPTQSLPADLPDRFVLVVDQTRGDASIGGAGATAGTFARMLDAARHEHPDLPLVIKGHPDVTVSAKQGHFAPTTTPDAYHLTAPVNPWLLVERATTVYTVSSQLGYEALLAGRPVRCFGMGFYAGWGLTEDEQTCPRRGHGVDLDALFAATHLLYPVYYDPYRDRLTDFETAARQLDVRARAAEPAQDIDGETFVGVRLWKRRSVARFRPDYPTRTRHVTTLPATDERRHVWVWGGHVPVATVRDEAQGVGSIEDGFLRSVGLGAALTEPVSLVFDRSGIYFDPSGPSDLEQLIGGPPPDAHATERARLLRQSIVETGLSKYNIGTPWSPARPREGHACILVPGQVSDDASILRGAGGVRDNLALLETTRAANPDAYLVYKPHPDVEAGLRAGHVAPADLDRLADEVVRGADAAQVLAHVTEVWTITSLIGFEALLRGLPVTCLGAPFYAGWGLTRDLGPVPDRRRRRRARPGLDHLVWAALIAYPRYVDPVTGLACSPELIVERLASGEPGRRAGVLSKLQALFAGQSWLWR